MILALVFFFFFFAEFLLLWNMVWCFQSDMEWMRIMFKWTVCLKGKISFYEEQVFQFVLIKNEKSTFQQTTFSAFQQHVKKTGLINRILSIGINKVNRCLFVILFVFSISFNQKSDCLIVFFISCVHLSTEIQFIFAVRNCWTAFYK